MSKAAEEEQEEQEEAAGPSVESLLPQERMAARRLRIAAHNEAKAREERGEESEKEVKEEKRSSQQQVELSEGRVTNLLSDGTKLITNLQVAADAKESRRRTDLRAARRLQVQKLESEARSSMQRFEEITGGWSQAKAKVIPQDLHEALGSQQQLCAQLLEDKNTLINDLQQELKGQDDRYVKELKQQAEEVDLMIERMEEQVKSLLRTNREELKHIEKAYEDERKVLLTGNKHKWEQLMTERSTKELESVIQRRRMVEEYEDMLQQLRLAEIEDYNVIKDQLETDVQMAQQWKQQQKATAQLNQDKQEFNIHVLTHREKDSAIIQSKLKRKITRQQDVLNGLKVKCVQQTKQSATESRNQSDDYTRNMQQYRHMQKKMRHFAAFSAERLAAVWQMNEAEVRELAERVLDIDRLLYEQQLGLAWERPPMPPYKLLPSSPQGPATADASVGPSSSMAGAGAESMMAYSEAYSGRASFGSESSAGYAAKGERGKVSAKTVKKLLQLLCDEAGFLIESKLLTLLTPLDKDNQSLIKLDSIFCALGIESKVDVYRLAEFFSNYQHQQTQQADAEESRANSTASVTSDLLHPNDVLAALKAFTAQYRRPRSDQNSPHSIITAGHDGPNQAAFWESLANVLPESKLKTWTALESALEKYHTVLTERSQLFTETQALKHQNAELRTLLHQSLNSKVNSELEVPPTQLMKMAPK
ncbi:unnamed protein product [Merluccius merluccius]